MMIPTLPDQRHRRRNVRRDSGRRGPQLSHSQPLAVLPVLPKVGTRIPLTRWLSVFCLPAEHDDSDAT